VGSQKVTEAWGYLPAIDSGVPLPREGYGGRREAWTRAAERRLPQQHNTTVHCVQAGIVYLDVLARGRKCARCWLTSVDSDRFSLLRMTMLPPCVVVNGSAEQKTWITQVFSVGTDFTSGMCVKPAGGDAPVQSEDFGEYDNPTDYT